VVRVDDGSDARGVVLVAELSPAGRVVVRGRFAVDVVAAGRKVGGLPGDALEAAVEVRVVLRAAGRLFSSPDVTDDRSGSASEPAVDLEASPVLLATVPGGGRVGGLFKLDPAVPDRIVALASGFDAVVEARAVELDA
jgi:hypothetical protein